MKKNTFLLLLPLLTIGCSNVEMGGLGQEQEPTELRLSKGPILVHSCNNPSCEHINKTVDTIVVLNGEGSYRVVADREDIVYYHATGEEVRAKTSDVLEMRVKQDTIFIKYLRPDIMVANELFRVYDKENNRGKFYVADPGIIGMY